jgi:cytidylate kinase
VVIAIDGPSGVGKSTVSRGVADALGVEYLDTGSTYRAATLAVLRSGADIADEAAVMRVLEAASITYEQRGIYLDGLFVGEEVRSPEVTAASSVVAAHPGVRENLVAMQRAWVDSNDRRAVVEGRDIGTAVLPAADVKVFLTASPEIRAARRAGDDEAAGKAVAEVADAMARRDRIDSTRETSPLRPAADAVIIDTSTLSQHEVIDAVLVLVLEGGHRPRPI